MSCRRAAHQKSQSRGRQLREKRREEETSTVRREPPDSHRIGYPDSLSGIGLEDGAARAVCVRAPGARALACMAQSIAHREDKRRECETLGAQIALG